MRARWFWGRWVDERQPNEWAHAGDRRRLSSLLFSRSWRTLRVVQQPHLKISLNFIFGGFKERRFFWLVATPSCSLRELLRSIQRFRQLFSIPSEIHTNSSLACFFDSATFIHYTGMVLNYWISYYWFTWLRRHCLVKTYLNMKILNEHFMDFHLCQTCYLKF